MLLTEFDEKKYKRTVYNEGYEDGEQAGYSKGFGLGRSSLLEEKVQKKLQCGKDIARIAEELEEEQDVIAEIAGRIRRQ